MRVANVHRREYAAAAAELGELLDSLGSAHDRLWPRSKWPPMVLRPGLQAGADGGHGPIRYSVEHYEPGQRVVFRFRHPGGWVGTHAFEVEPVPDGRVALVHSLEMNATGWGLLLWLAVFRPLHDALLEDALDTAAEQLGSAPNPRAAWSPYVRLLRRLLRPRRSA